MHRSTAASRRCIHTRDIPTARQESWPTPVTRKLLPRCQSPQSHIQSLNLSFQDNHGLLTKTDLFGLENFTLIVAIADGLGEGFLLWILDMAAVDADPFLQLIVAFVDFVLECLDLHVLGLDFFQQEGYFCGCVCHCDSELATC